MFACGSVGRAWAYLNADRSSPHDDVALGVNKPPIAAAYPSEKRRRPSCEKTLANSAYVCKKKVQRLRCLPRLSFSRARALSYTKADMSNSTSAPSGITYVKTPLRNTVSDNAPVETLVAEIIRNVRERGDAAVRD